MAKQRYIALFDNGKARKRETLNRTYTHAWLVEYISVCRGTPKEGCDHEFQRPRRSLPRRCIPLCGVCKSTAAR